MNDLDWLARNEHEWKHPDCDLIRRVIDVAFYGESKNHLYPREQYYTRAQWQTRRDELQGKPSWADAPEWADALVQNLSGCWFWCVGDQQPNDLGGWDSAYGKELECGEGEVLGEWNKTLERRPESPMLYTQQIGRIIATRKQDHAVPSDLDDLKSLDEPEPEYTGGSVSYYTVRVDHPTNPERDQYEAECNDVIEALKMNYAEGNAFKAIWRKCAARLGTAKKGYSDGVYDAEKVVFFGERMVEQEKHKKP